MSKVCLVFIFNHRYEKNIEKLKKIYKNRFSLFRFIVPFYKGDENEEVIPVYESSYYFEGYYMQAAEKLAVLDADDFLFIADDLILNPHVNENNFRDYFGLAEEKGCYINDINMLNSPGGIEWMHAMYSSLPFFTKGILWQRELPSYEEAMGKFEQFFEQPYKETYDEEFFYTGNDIEKIKSLVQTFYDNNERSFNIPYPMAKGYSDIVILSKNDLRDFSRLCGIFSSMDIFAEIAIPTAIVLLFKKEDVSCIKNTDYISKLLWYDYEYFNNVVYRYKNDFNLFYDGWDSDWLYIHPIKLSEWNVE